MQCFHVACMRPAVYYSKTSNEHGALGDTNIEVVGVCVFMKGKNLYVCSWVSVIIHIFLGKGDLCYPVWSRRLKKTALVISTEDPVPVSIMCSLAEFHTWK